MPQVRSKTSGRTSIAMSQRTPSHCPAIFTQLADHRFLRGRVAVVELKRVRPAGEIGIAAVGEQQVAAPALRPRCSSAARAPGRARVPGMKYSGCSSTHG